MPPGDPRLDEVYRRGEVLRSRRHRRLLAGSSAIAVVLTVVGLNIVLDDSTDETRPVDVVGETSTTIESTSTSSTTSTEPVHTTLAVTGGSVGANPFGVPAERAADDVRSILGDPDADSGWMRWWSPDEMDQPPIGGEGRFFASQVDDLGPSAPYRWVRNVCWDGFCIHLGGSSELDRTLRGWSLSAEHDSPPPDPSSMPVTLTSGNLTLGSSWAEVQAAFASATAVGAEGLSIAIEGLPFPTINDGVGGWRLEGLSPPAPDQPEPEPSARLTRLSAGEGPEPGCC